MKKQSELIAQLSKMQKFYIQEHRQRNLKRLALDCSASITAVRAYLSYLDRKDVQKAEEAEAERIRLEEEKKKAQPATTTVKADSLMHKRRGSVVMTKEASELADATRPRNRMSPRLAKNTQKIRPD